MDIDPDIITNLSEILGAELLENPVEVEGEPGVFFLGDGPSPEELDLIVPSNATAANITNANQLQPDGELSLNLAGTGLTVGVWDAGYVQYNHQEFGSRVTPAPNQNGFDDHATHVAGTIGATGVDSEARGMANAVQIVSYDWDNDLAELQGEAQNGLHLSNHSYGTAAGWDLRKAIELGGIDIWFGDRSLYATEDPKFGQYDNRTRQLDGILHSNPQLLSVWAAGNDRHERFLDIAFREEMLDVSAYATFRSTAPTGKGWYIITSKAYDAANANLVSPPPSDGDGGTGYDSLTKGGGENAKNTLVVGAVDDGRQIAEFSSWGPTDDGRIKPDVVGNGVDVYSPVAFDPSSGTLSNSAYDSYPGTSMAAPNVTGTATLLYEHYQNLFGNLPNSATGKALLIHTATDLGNTGPDYVYGWGLVDGAAAANFLTNVADAENQAGQLFEENYEGAEQTFEIEVGSADTPVKATIVWTDPESKAQSEGLDDRTPMLVNNLDLWITDENGNIYNPWTLNPANPDAPAVQNQRNTLDNVEQVLFNAPAAGTYTIHVGSRTGESFVQSFSLMVSGSTEITTDPELPTGVLTINSPIPDDTDPGEAVQGLPQNDTTVIDEQLVYIFSNSDDFMSAPSSTPRMMALSGNDMIIGLIAGEWFNGNKGADEINGAGGADTIFGGKGSDSLDGDADSDRVYGNLNNDVLTGGDGNDTIFGGQQNDIILSGAGDDVLFGDQGQDKLTGGAGDDVFALPGNTAAASTLNQADVIMDYGTGNDSLMLPPGVDSNQLSFSSVNLEVDSNPAEVSTVIELNGTFLAILKGVTSQSELSFVPFDPSVIPSN